MAVRMAISASNQTQIFSMSILLLTLLHERLQNDQLGKPPYFSLFENKIIVELNGA